MSQSMPSLVVSSPGLQAVREFWNQHPLFAGESSHAPGERAFFEEHERVVLHEHSGSLDRIFMLDAAAGGELLDVGCGIGFWVQQFCRLGGRVNACDMSDTAVRLTQRRTQLFELAASVCQGNAEQLPYGDASFDHVNCQGVIHHTPNTAQCIAEFHRVLKPDGTLCFSVYYKVLALRWCWLYRVVCRLTRSWLGMRGRGRENMMSVESPEELVRCYDGSENPIGKAFTKKQLEAMLEGRFRLLEAKRIGFPRRVLPIGMPDGLHRFLSRVFGLMIVLRCRKLESPA